ADDDQGAGFSHRPPTLSLPTQGEGSSARSLHSLSNGFGGRPVGSAAARFLASSNFFSRMSFWFRVCATDRANLSSSTSFWEATRETSSSKFFAGAFFLSAQTTEPVSGSTFRSAPQQGQETSSASGMPHCGHRDPAGATQGMDQMIYLKMKFMFIIMSSWPPRSP